jgi:hypothetical protein
MTPILLCRKMITILCGYFLANFGCLRLYLFLMKITFAFLTLLSLSLLATAQRVFKPSFKILFVPLDDRPPCLQFTKRMGLIGNVELVSPPAALLGKFTTPGQPEKIINWIFQQDLASFDAAILSIDMLVYGGLVASRTYSVEAAETLQRVDVISKIHKIAPSLTLYAQSVIMRLAPTADGKNDSFYGDLSKWAEISAKEDEKSKAETKILAEKIPADALANYKNARKRNLQINFKTIDFVKSGMIHYLILSQDDAKPVGVHVQDRKQLIASITNAGVAGEIAVQPGADEVSMLLLARALHQHYKMSPKIKAVFSSDVTANTIMPFEDKPLKETVSFHIRATGSTEVQGENEADLLFFVFASRKEPGRAVSFAKEIEASIRKGKGVIVADIDPKGDVQGGDSAFTMELANRRLLPLLYGYASWNTAANTIGTALPQGEIFHLAQKKLLSDKAIAQQIRTAQNWFLFHRVLDDYYFHGLIRSKANIYFNQNKMSSKILDDNKNKSVEDYAAALLQKSFNDLNHIFSQGSPGGQGVRCHATELSFKLPWNRTFEAAINFKMECSKH